MDMIFVSTKAQLGFGMPLFLQSFALFFVVSPTITGGLWLRPQSRFIAKIVNIYSYVTKLDKPDSWLYIPWPYRDIKSKISVPSDSIFLSGILQHLLFVILGNQGSQIQLSQWLHIKVLTDFVYFKEIFNRQLSFYEQFQVHWAKKDNIFLANRFQSIQNKCPVIYFLRLRCVNKRNTSYFAQLLNEIG